MAHTPDQVKAAIKLLPDLDIEQLSHQWKCAHSKADKLYKPFLDAAERELAKRRRQSPTEDTPDDTTEVPSELHLPSDWS